MPSHVTNKMKIVGKKKDVEEVLDFIKDDKLGLGTIDFNKITPMPIWVYGSQDGCGISLDDRKKWGNENTSLVWSIKNWGTKWNAYQQPDRRATSDTIYFQTASHAVPDLIQKIAWIFPDITIEYSFANEDILGGKCGHFIFKESNVLKNTPFESGSNESVVLGIELIEDGEIPEYIIFSDETNSYEYLEEYK